MCKHAIYYLFDYAKPELEWCNENLEPGLIDKLNNVINNDFPRVEYREVIEILKKPLLKVSSLKLKISTLVWILNLNTNVISVKSL